MAKYRVEGADRETGASIVLEVEASGVQAAQAIVNQKGVLVRDVRQAQAHNQPVLSKNFWLGFWVFIIVGCWCLAGMIALVMISDLSKTKVMSGDAVLGFMFMLATIALLAASAMGLTDYRKHLKLADKSNNTKP